MKAANLIVLGVPQAVAARFAEPLGGAMERFGINTPARKAAFVAQLLHESAMFTRTGENLNYSAKRLREVWPKRFPSDEIAAQYERSPEKLANLVYAGRMGNGDEKSGDGWRFRGRGPIHLTGRSNYGACGKAIGHDLIAKPELLEQPDVGCLAAGWFWAAGNPTERDLNLLADRGDIAAISKAINGGTHGLAERIALTQRVLKEF